MNSRMCSGEYVMMSLLVTMTTLTSLLMSIGTGVTADGTFIQVGANLSIPARSSPDLLPSQIYIIYNVVQNDARLFAFSAIFLKLQPVHFQVYRSTGSSDGDAISTQYQLIADVPVIPSVLGREDFYIESLLTQKCVHVLPNDRLAVFFPNAISIQFSFSPTSTAMKSNQDVNSPPRVGQNISFDPISLPYMFSMAAQLYIDTSMNTSISSSPTPPLVNCIPGLVIPNSLHSTLPTTTVSITGAPGAVGAIGPVGSSGVVGRPGNLGFIGSIGIAGDIGPAGAPGLLGATGLTGAMGATGIVGPPGWTGGVGVMGSGGMPGFPGQDGPMGPPGLNFYVYIEQQAPPTPFSTPVATTLGMAPSVAASMQQAATDFWSQGDTPMIGVFIWLAILSFVLTILLITISVACCVCNRDHL